jgi:hypothetical protein
MSHDGVSLLTVAAEPKDYLIRMQGDSAIYEPDVAHYDEN